MNSNHHTLGRFANQFFRNVASHFIAKKNDIQFNYSCEKELDDLGFSLYKEGKNTYETDNTISIQEHEIMDYIENPEKMIHSNIIMTGYYQIKDLCFYLKKYFMDNEERRQQIMEKNPYQSRYNQNDDLFIHVRLGDIIQNGWNHSFDYYDSLMDDIYKKYPIQKGYISSDSLEHEICQRLIEKYNLTVFNDDEVHTIQFGSSCKYIVLSNGTFSWLIGFLGFFSTIYYPDPTMKPIWHGDIFVFPEWNKVNYTKET